MGFTAIMNNTPETCLVSQKYGCENQRKCNFQEVYSQIAKVWQTLSASNLHCLKGNIVGFIEFNLQDGEIFMAQ